MLVSMLAVGFFAFALLSLAVSVLVGVMAGKPLVVGPCRALGIYALGSGVAGGLVAVLFGFGMRWNVLGGAIMENPMLGSASWAAIGFGWSAASAFLLGLLIRRLLSRKAKPERG
jgi:hypothetical protein